MHKRFSITRVIVIGVLVLNVVAIGLGRMLAGLPSWRRLQPAKQVAINSYIMGDSGPGLVYLDLETGRRERLALPEGDLVDEASWSPWHDEECRSQLVGRWVNRTGEGTMRLGREFGLARYSFPDGEVLDQVSCAVVPNSPPCWLPGTQARILYAANDGSLYRFDFEGAKGEGATLSGRDGTPRPVLWKHGRPGAGGVSMRDPFWPVDARFRNRIIVSLACEHVQTEGRTWSPNELWWLELNQDATVIENAGRISDVVRATEPRRTVRYPVVGRNGDGGLQIAFLSREERQGFWDVQVAPIDVSGPAPIADVGHARLVAEHCHPAVPFLSEDGRWATCVQELGGKPETRRVPVFASPASRTLARRLQAESGPGA
jgi:hypothetical protein